MVIRGTIAVRPLIPEEVFRKVSYIASFFFFLGGGVFKLDEPGVGFFHLSYMFRPRFNTGARAKAKFSGANVLRESG